MNRIYIILITSILLASFALGCLVQQPWSDPMQPEPKPKPNPMSQAWEDEMKEEQMRREWEEEQMRREWEEEQQRQWEQEQQRQWEQDIEILLVNTGDLKSDDNYNLNSEYVIIWNTGDWDVDMSGWKLYDKSYKRGWADDHIFYFPFGFVLGAGESVIVYSGKGSATYEYTDSGTVIHKLFWGRIEGEGAQIWMDLGDCAYLEDNQGYLVHEYCW